MQGLSLSDGEEMGFVHLLRNQAAIGFPSGKEVDVEKLGVDWDDGRRKWRLTPLMRRVCSCLASGRAGLRTVFTKAHHVA